MADQQQQSQPPVAQTPTQPQQIAQSQQSQQQQLQQLQQQQQPRVSSVGTMSIQGMVAPQAPTPQPSLTAASNALRSPSTPIPQLQVIGQPMHGQSYLQQFQSYPQSFMLQNANALAAMQQMNQINLAMQQQHQQQQQQQNRAAAVANPGSPGGILSPSVASQMPTHMSLGGGGSLISSSMPGLMSQTAVAGGNNKAQGNGGKGQTVQGQGQNATAAIASMVAKQTTVLPTQQTAAPSVVLGQIGVFSNQGNAALGQNFVPQCTVSTHQGGLRLNQTQMVNTAGQIITSQPMQSILTNQAIMQAMASLQMQQGIPIAATAGHQQIINPNQSQMPTIFAGQNFLIRAPGPLPTQPITMTSMQAAFAGIKTQQPQQTQQQQTQQQGKTNIAGKVMLPSVSRTQVTAKIQPSVSQSARLNVPGIPKTARPRPKALPKTSTSSITTAPSNTTVVKSTVLTSTITTSTLTTAVVTSLPMTTAAVVCVAATLPIQAPISEPTPPVLTKVSAPPVSEVVAQALQPKSMSDSEVGTGKPPTSTAVSSTTIDSTLKSKIKATVASSSSVAAVPGNCSVKSSIDANTATAARFSPAISGEKKTIDEIVVEEKPIIAEVAKSGSSMNAAMEAAGLMTLVKETKPLPLSQPVPLSQTTPVVEKQRAIVKPQIITHIIEGFIIQEGPEPFPVQQSSLLQEFIPPKANSQQMKESEMDEVTSCDDEPPTLLSQVDAHLSSTQLLNRQPQKEQEVKDEPKNTGILLECELCQKVVPATSFNSSQRFCSLSCSRRHNVSHTRRVSLFKSRGTTRKRKHILGRKNWRVSKSGRLTYAKTSADNNSNNDDSNTAPVGDEMSSSNSTRETSSSAGSPPRSQEYDMEVDANMPRSDPGKWTVIEVYDFIQAMPGCGEYAEEFRSQEIDGQALLLLKEDHLMTAMNIKLGPALKICSKINTLKSDSAPS